MIPELRATAERLMAMQAKLDADDNAYWRMEQGAVNNLADDGIELAQYLLAGCSASSELPVVCGAEDSTGRGEVMDDREKRIDALDLFRIQARNRLREILRMAENERPFDAARVADLCRKLLTLCDTFEEKS